MLHYLTRYLIEQDTQFTVLVVNQVSGKTFNRAKLFNIGFTHQTQKANGQDECFVFHDVDFIAENSNFVYYCDEKHPLHLSAWLHEENYVPFYKMFMGGVTSFTKEQFTSINGYSNETDLQVQKAKNLTFYSRVISIHKIRVLGMGSRR